LAASLSGYGVKVWYDEFALVPGDSLSRSIDKGLAKSAFGLIILSPSFFAKPWPEYELRGLTAKETGKDKVIIPVWHNVSREDVLRYSPPLADKIALQSNQYSTDELAIRIIQIIRPDLFAKVLKKRIPIVDRSEVDRLIDTVEHRLLKAKRDVWISGNDCKFVAESQSGFIEEVLKRKVQVKVLCTDPECAAVDMLTKIDPRLPTRNTFIDSMISVEKVLRDFRSRYPSTFEFRYLPILPALGFFMVDPEEPTGIVKIEIYTAKPWEPVASRPHLILPQELFQWRQYFIAQWKNYWDLSRVP
jgi:hypothetical protein